MINATRILKDIIALNYGNQTVIHTYKYSVNIQVESTNGYVQVPKNTTSVKQYISLESLSLNYFRKLEEGGYKNISNRERERGVRKCNKWHLCQGLAVFTTSFT